MRILAIDDDPIILALLTTVVGNVGEHELHTSTNPYTALQIAKAYDFDCFFLDIQMPDLNGIEICRRLRADEKYKNTPILMITSRSSREFVDGAFKAGATDYLTKPLKPQDLLERVELFKSLTETVPTPGADGIAGEAGVFGVETAFELNGVDSAVHTASIENYLRQLSRSAQSGTTVFSITISNIQDHFDTLSPVNFRALIARVAQHIAKHLSDQPFLMSYVGGGTFTFVTAGGHAHSPRAVANFVQDELNEIGLPENDGSENTIEVQAGKSISLGWRHETRIVDALLQARMSAERGVTFGQSPLDRFVRVSARKSLVKQANQSLENWS